MTNYPTKETNTKDHFQLSTATIEGKEFVLDRPEVSCFPQLLPFQNATGPDNLEFTNTSTSTGAPELDELAASGVVGILMDTNADEFAWLWCPPEDADLAKDMDFRVIWSNREAAATGSCLWTLTYTEVVVGTTTLIDPATALDTVLVNQADLGAEIPNATAYGTIDGGTLSFTLGTDYLALKVEATTLTTVADVHLIDVKCRYYRKYLGVGV